MTREVPQEGQPAPRFALADHHGQTVDLADFAGRQNVMLVFYPFAFTGVCTGELRTLEERLESFAGAGTQVLAVSCDSRFSLRVFAEREGLTYPLLSDFWPHGEVARAYGVLDEDKGAALRGTFVIDTDGVVRWTVVNALPDARDVDEYLGALTRLSA
ncbi:MAG: peroxiredoxin [Actinomycetes bacterium]